MRFLYDENAGKKRLDFSSDANRHIRARRLKDGDILSVRNLKDGLDYKYIVRFLGRSVCGELAGSEAARAGEYPLILAWAVCEASSIEKSLAALNELGAGELWLVWAEFSQRSVRLDMVRFERIIHASCEQCGRGEPMKIRVFEGVDAFIAASQAAKKMPALVDFGGEELGALMGADGSEEFGAKGVKNRATKGQNSGQNSGENADFKIIPFIGPEGGFSESERQLITPKIGLKCQNILKSTTAITAIAAKLLA